MWILALAVVALCPPAPTQDAAAAPPWSLYESDPTKVGVVTNADAATQGLTLVMPLNDKAVYLVDMDGEVVHTWPTDSAPGGWVYLLDDGSLLRAGREDHDPKFRGGGIGGRIQRVAPDGKLVWNFSLADHGHWQHHDLEPLPNGNVLLIAWERKSAAEAIARGRDPRQVGKVGLWPDKVVEVRPILPDRGEIVWEWHAWDHVIQDVDDGLPGYGTIPDDPGRIDINYDHRDTPPRTAAQIAEARALAAQMAALGYGGGSEDDSDADGSDSGSEESEWDRSGDWLHTNAVDYCAELDLIVLSSPELNEVFVIDHSTTTAEAATDSGGRWGRGGRLLWRYGNPKNYGLGEGGSRRLWYQHDPTFLPIDDSNELRLLLFNNGRGRPDGDYSSVDELLLPFDPDKGFRRAPGSAFLPERPAWSYSDGDRFFSGFISGAQRLWTGNTLACSGATGRIFEVTPRGEVVWDYRSPLGGSVNPPDHAGNAPPRSLYRAARVPRDHPGVVALKR